MALGNMIRKLIAEYQSGWPSTSKHRASCSFTITYRAQACLMLAAISVPTCNARETTIRIHTCGTGEARQENRTLVPSQADVWLVLA